MSTRNQPNNAVWQMPNFDGASSPGMPNYQSKILMDYSNGQTPGSINTGIDLNKNYSMNTGFGGTSTGGMATSAGGDAWQKSWLGEGGLGSLALGGVGTLLNGYLGFKQLGMAKDQLKESKRQFNMNWGAQKKAVNNQLHNAQFTRNSATSDPANKKDMAEYMKKWGIE